MDSLNIPNIDEIIKQIRQWWKNLKPFQRMAVYSVITCVVSVATFLICHYILESGEEEKK